ncbi:MAG: GNAT family N-acetyltransferase [Actinomycetota bacterium]
MVTIERIRPDDWVALRAVRIAALTDSPSAFGSTLERELAFSDADWQLRADASASGSERATFLARSGGEVVGIVGGFVDGDAVELVSMWVAPPARGTGLGRSLVERVVEWTTDDTEAPRVDLWVVRGNDAALRLYESVGFAVTDDVQPLPSDPCRDEIRMTLAVR